MAKIIIEIETNNKRLPAVKEYVQAIGQHMQPIRSVNILEEVQDAEPKIQQDVVQQGANGHEERDGTGREDEGRGISGNSGEDAGKVPGQDGNPEERSAGSVSRSKRGPVKERKSKKSK